MTLTLIHTADWQIGKRFGAFDEDVAALLRQQRLATVAQIGRVASQIRADAVLVAGDVFDSDALADETLRRTVRAMDVFNGPWLLLPGNHDPHRPEGVWDRVRRLGAPDNVVPLTEARPWLSPDRRFAVLPAPLFRHVSADDPTRCLDGLATPDGVIRIGLAHGALANRLPGSDQTRTAIAEDRAQRAGLAYLALGDWHGMVNIAPRTWYSGTPEPDRFRHDAPGRVLAVRFADSGSDPAVEPITVGRFLWLDWSDVTVRRAADVDALAARLTALPTPHEDLVLRLAVIGTVDLTARHQLDRLLADWQARLRAIQVDLSGLLAEATDDDLDQIDARGFVAAAIRVLRCRRDDPNDAERGTADDALQWLYARHHRLGRR